MSEQGFVAVYRGIFDHPIFAPEPFTEREAWVWLIMAAAWNEKRVRVGRAMIDLKRGQCAFAMRFMAERFRWSESRVRRFLKRLTGDAMIAAQSTREATLITICNYEQHQLARRTDDSPSDAQPDAKATQRIITNNKKEEEVAPSGASPPRVYAFESGVIRLNKKDLDLWQASFSHLDLRAELIALTDWAGQQRSWFNAVSGALAKRNREVKAAKEKPPETIKWNGLEGVL